MSAIADFRLIEKSKLDDLKIAATITTKKGFFTKTVVDNYSDYLDSNTQQLKEFDGDGYIFATLLIYLQEQKSVDLLNSEYAELANEISAKRENSTIIFTKKQSSDNHDQLNAENYNADELNAFNLEFSEVDNPQFALSALNGIAALRENLDTIPDDNYVLLLTMG